MNTILINEEIVKGLAALIKKNSHLLDKQDQASLKMLMNSYNIAAKNQEKTLYNGLFTCINIEFFNYLGKSQAYFLGIMASDGHILKDYSGVSISQSGAEGLRTIKAIKKLIGYRGKIISQLPKKGNEVHSLHIRSKTIVDFLLSHGIGSQKTYTLEFPDLPETLVPYFLRGYIDGDGCLGYYQNNKTHRYFHLSFVGTESFTKRALEYLPFEGIISKINRCRNLYEVRFTGIKAFQVYDFVYKKTNDLNLISPKQRIYANLKPRFINQNQAERFESELRILHKERIPVTKIADLLGIKWKNVYKCFKRLGLQTYAEQDETNIFSRSKIR